MITKKPATPTRNLQAPKSDQLIVLYAFDEGAGAVLDNKGTQPEGSPEDFDGTINNDVVSPGSWEIDVDEGDYYAYDTYSGNNSIEVIDRTGEADYEIPRGSLFLRVASFNEPGAPGEQQWICTTGSGIAATPGQININRQFSLLPGFLRVRHTDAGTLNFPITAEGQKNNLLVTWGERGISAYLDGVQYDFPTPTTNGVIIKANTLLRLNMNLSGAGGRNRFYLFGLWSAQLDEDEIYQLMSDPYILIRNSADVSSLFRTYAGPQTGRQIDGGTTFSMVTSAGLAGSAYYRVKYEEGVDFLSSPSTSSVASTNQANSRLNLNLTGLSGNFKWICEVSNDNFAAHSEIVSGGMGRGGTKPEDTDSVDIVVISDDHLAMDALNEVNPAMGYNRDIVRHADGTAKHMNAHKAIQSITELHPDLLINLGDCFSCDRCANQNEAYSRAENYRNWTQPLLREAPMVFVHGNHEGGAGYFQHKFLANNYAIQKWGTNTLKRFILNPDSDTYEQKGEGAAGYDSTNDWLVGQDPDSADIEANTTLNCTPLENFYAFRYGPALFIALDPYRYTEPGALVDQTDPGQPTRPTASWVLGTTQLNWLEWVLANFSAPWTVVMLHHLVGSEPIGIVAGTDYYGRQAGTNIDDPSVWTAVGDSIPPQLTSFHNLMIRYGVDVVLKGHDHRFAHVIKNGVNYISAPTLSAPSIVNNGWNFSEMFNSYGTTQLFGQDKADHGMVYAYNIYGYLRFQITTTTFEVSLIQTAIATDPSAIGDDIFTKPIYPPERYIGPTYTPVGDQVTLEDIPEDVVSAVKLSKLSGATWWDDLVEGDNIYTAPSGQLPYDESHETSTITLEESPGEDVKISWVPRELYSDFLTPISPTPQPQPDDSRARVSFNDLAGSAGSSTSEYERAKFKGNEVNLTINRTSHSETIWEIRKEHESSGFTITTNENGVSGLTNVGNVIQANLSLLSITLNRTYNYYVRVNIGEGWSDWSYIDLSGEIRTVVGKHRDNEVETKTTSGVKIITTNPKWSEAKTSRGIKITNNIYKRERSRQ